MAAQGEVWFDDTAGRLAKERALATKVPEPQ